MIFRIVNGMIAANEFVQSGGHDTVHESTRVKNAGAEPPVKVILEIDKQDWDFQIQAGAFRRVIMNICKYLHCHIWVSN